MLVLDNLYTEFVTPNGHVHAVNGVDLQVKQGEILGLVGESGSGKSATIRSVLRLLPPSGQIVKGSIRLGDTELTTLSASGLRQIRGRRVGFVAQSPFGALNPILPLWKQFRNVLRSTGERVDRATVFEIGEELLGSVGITDPKRVLSGYAHELSGGMAQRVVISMSLLLKPDLVLADEPTTALDVTVQKQILELLRHRVQVLGAACVLVTHDLGVVANYCDRIAVMYAGKIVEAGTVADVFDEPAHPYTLALLKSVPQLGRPVASLPGGPPELLTYPTGCPFLPRCKFAIPLCASEAPPSEDVSAGHTSACHRRAEIATLRRAEVDT